VHGVNGMASFIQSMNIFNNTEVAFFNMQAMLPENGPFSQIYYNEFSSEWLEFSQISKVGHCVNRWKWDKNVFVIIFLFQYSINLSSLDILIIYCGQYIWRPRDVASLSCTCIDKQLLQCCPWPVLTRLTVHGSNTLIDRTGTMSF